jgi:TRAP-type C4-dicarboxylate transport system substrate-binding protein
MIQGAVRSRVTILVAVVTLGSILVATSACGAGANKSGGPVPAKPLVLRLADPDGNSEDEQEFVDAVQRLSHGTIRVDVTTFWRHGEIDYDRGTLSDVRTGKVDLAKIGVRSLDELGLPSFQPLLAPLLIDSLPLERAVLESSLPSRLLPSLSRLGVVGVAMLPGAIRRPFGRRAALVSPQAFGGTTIGIRPSLVAAATIRALGGTPRGYPPSHLPSTFDGAELDPISLEGSGFDAPGTTLARNVSLWPRLFVLVANADVWRSLTPAQRATLRRAGRQALAPAISRLAKRTRESTKTLCRRGTPTLVTASPAQLAALHSSLEPVYSQLRAKPGERRLLEQLIDLKRRLGATSEELPTCKSAGPVSGTARTPLDGVYSMTTTAADLRKAGATDSDLIPENYGTWIYVFDRGRFADTQEDAQACTWGYGTFTVAGNETAWRFTDGGGISPNSAYNRPGEAFRFRWSRYRDVVALSAVKGAISPANFRARPWRLINANPSKRYFSKRCPPPAQALPGTR